METSKVQTVSLVEFDLGLMVIMWDAEKKSVAAYSLNHILSVNRLALIEGRDVMPIAPIAVTASIDEAERWMKLNGASSTKTVGAEEASKDGGGNGSVPA